MSVKHVVRYYKQVSSQYFDAVHELKDMEKEVSHNLLPPEMLTQMQQMVEPIKNNYMTLSWVMHLLKQPNKPSKIKNYQRKNKVFLNSLDKSRNKDGVLEENNLALNGLKSTHFDSK